MAFNRDINNIFDRYVNILEAVKPTEEGGDFDPAAAAKKRQELMGTAAEELSDMGNTLQDETGESSGNVYRQPDGSFSTKGPTPDPVTALPATSNTTNPFNAASGIFRLPPEPKFSYNPSQQPPQPQKATQPPSSTNPSTQPFNLNSTNPSTQPFNLNSTNPSTQPFNLDSTSNFFPSEQPSTSSPNQSATTNNKDEILNLLNQAQASTDPEEARRLLDQAKKLAGQNITSTTLDTTPDTTKSKQQTPPTQEELDFLNGMDERQKQLPTQSSPSEPTNTTATTTNTQQQSNNNLKPNVSIVDYLKSINQPSDFQTRKKMAEAMGIKNYSGTADQNIQLLKMVQGQGGQAQTAASALPGAGNKPGQIKTPTPSTQTTPGGQFNPNAQVRRASPVNLPPGYAERQNSTLPGVLGTASNMLGRAGDTVENFFKGQLGKGAQQRPSQQQPVQPQQTTARPSQQQPVQPQQTTAKKSTYQKNPAGVETFFK